MRTSPNETNRTAANRESREDLKCSYCPPNKGDNARGKRRPRTDKYKTTRKGRA